MITRVDGRLRAEAARFRLAFACPSCASYDEPASACSLGYPNADHVDEALEARETVVFCKAFELR